MACTPVQRAIDVVQSEADVRQFLASLGVSQKTLDRTLVHTAMLLKRRLPKKAHAVQPAAFLTTTGQPRPVLHGRKR
ncbi:MAG: hypothetical protein QOI12_87 [Alphaproteobacteria bacterium]|jgi:hypothetical protein|nr:hypothetical protein [Alphaproteobacteria bacterium]